MEPFLLRQQVGQVEDRLDRSLAGADGVRSPGQQDVGGGEEPSLDRRFVEERSGASLFVFVLLVTLPDRPFVDIVGVPDLGAVPAATISAFDFPGKEVDTAVPVPALGASGHLALHHLKGLRIDDGLVLPHDLIVPVNIEIDSAFNGDGLWLSGAVTERIQAVICRLIHFQADRVSVLFVSWHSLYPPGIWRIIPVNY